MRAAILTLAAVASLVSAPSAIAADDPFEGGFATSCGNDVTCYADIVREARGRHVLKWEAATRTGETICKQEISLKSGDFEKEPGLVLENVPHGVLQDGSRVVALDLPNAQLHLWSEGTPCSNAWLIPINGIYYAYGDI